MDTNNMVVSQLQKSIKEAFKFGESKLRVYGTIDQPWFCARDVCKILEYEKPQNAISRHVDSDDKITYETLTSKVALKRGHLENIEKNKNILKMTYINKSGLYALIFFLI